MMRMPFLLRRCPVLCVVLVVWRVVVVNSFVPPRESLNGNGDNDHDNHDRWESVHTIRRRLGLSYNYTPDLLNPELCRYLSEEECQDVDVSLQDHAQRMRRLPQLTRERQPQPHHQEEEDNQARRLTIGQRQLAPNIGIVKVLVILLQFTDHLDRTLPHPSVYDEMWNSKGKNSDLIPSGSVAQWFQKNSYGLYEIEARIVPWTQSDGSELFYSFGSSGLVTQFQQAFWPVLDELDANGIDWSQYDIDGDGVLDAVTVLHTGYAAELKGVDCNSDREYYNRIWSHAYAHSFNSWASSDGQYRVGGYTVASAYRDTCGYEPARIGTMTHEFMHTLGLVDLYDGQDARVGRGVGGFDIMATPYGPKDDPSWPGHLSAWSRTKIGWNMPIEITQDGEYSIQASELSNQAYAIRKRYPYDEYLLIENRQPLWFDARLWTGGLVIYHIDDRAALQLKRGYPGQEGWPRNGNHYQVAVLASDGQYNLEKGDNVGDVGDFWKEGMMLGPGNGRVFPNTDAYQFGSIRVTGITIYDIKKEDTIMTFRVSGLTDDATEGPAIKPIPIPLTTPSPTVAPEKPKPTKPEPTLPEFTDNIIETPTILETLPPDDDSTTIAKDREYQGTAATTSAAAVSLRYSGKSALIVVGYLLCSFNFFFL